MLALKIVEKMHQVINDSTVQTLFSLHAMDFDAVFVTSLLLMAVRMQTEKTPLKMCSLSFFSLVSVKYSST